MSVNVKDVMGNSYNYGFIDTGYMLREEYGDTFDSEDITFVVQPGDLPLIDGDFVSETQPDILNIIMVANLDTLNKIAYTHYVDTEYVGTQFIIDPFERETADLSGTEFEDGSEMGEGRPKDRRVANICQGLNNVKTGVFHSGELSISTNNSSVGFEPLMLVYLFTSRWEHLSTTP
jgi:hypothetical protein